MSKIIFLDIDGPVITEGLYQADQFCSINRSLFNISALDNLQKLCSLTGAKIVTNSMHNYYVVEDRTIRDDLLEWGIPKHHFHPTWRTIFPHIDYSRINNTRRGIGRQVAIDTWMIENGECTWVCFDDRHFTDDPRLLLVDPAKGITQKLFDRAFKMLGKR
jgi:5'(3')-deoxyribonucleotidase